MVIEYVLVHNSLTHFSFLCSVLFINILLLSQGDPVWFEDESSVSLLPGIVQEYLSTTEEASIRLDDPIGDQVRWW